MLKLSLRRKPSKTAAPAVCMAHRNSIQEAPDDGLPYVRKDVFHQYAQKMDKCCGNHEDMISSVSKKIDKLNQLFIGLVVSLLVAGVGFILNVVLRLI